MKDADTILREALELPTAERGRVAARLIESLDAEGPPLRRSDDQLADVINERVRALGDGRARVVDGKQAMEELRAERRARRPS